jgi:hypothetical protein
MFHYRDDPVMINDENNSSVRILAQNNEAGSAMSLSWQTAKIAVPRIMFTGLDPNEVAQFQRVNQNPILKILHQEMSSPYFLT